MRRRRGPSVLRRALHTKDWTHSMDLFKPITALGVTATLLFSSCSAEDAEPEATLFLGDTVSDHAIEQRLGLVPQLADASVLAEAGNLVDASMPRYVILSAERGGIDLGSVEVMGADGDACDLRTMFSPDSVAPLGVLEHSALLLISVPESEVETLCERFQFAHDDGDMVIAEDNELLFLTDGPEGKVHALCVLPSVREGEPGDEPITDLVAEDEPMGYGSGTYTAKITSLQCNNPRDWENWPYNGDETRLRAHYNNVGGDQIWSSNNVESGDWFAVNRFIHFNTSAKISVYDYDSGLWNASDKLGERIINTIEACGGTLQADFDGSGGGHNWNYDVMFKVYGPNCPCQAAEPDVYSYSQVETCQVTSQSVDYYTYYCSGGVEWQQAWGDVTRHCQTHSKQYDVSCEMNTFVGQTLMSECDKYQYDVPIGSPVQTGNICPGGGGSCPIALEDQSFADAFYAGDQPVSPIVAPIEEPCML